MKNTLIKILIALSLLFAFPAWATESANGDTVPVTTATITDFFGHSWTLANDTTRTVKRDGVATNVTGAQELWYLNHQVYAFTAGIGWQVFGPAGPATTATAVANPLQFWQNMPKTIALANRGTFGPQTSITCSGVAISAGANIQTAVNANPVNTVFCLAVGTYSAQSVFPKSGQQFIGTYSGGSGYALMDGGGTGTIAFGGTADHVVIKNLKITNYNNAVQTGFINITGPYLLVQNNLITASVGGAGIRVDGNYMMIYNNQINLNAQEGYVGVGSFMLFDNNEIANNNPTAAFWDGGEQGGGKLLFTDSATFWYNTAHDNAGSAFWTDANNVDTKYWFNSSTNDTGGIEHEISYNASIIGNVLTNVASKGVDSGCPGFFIACAGVAIENSQGIAAPNPRAGIVEVAYNTIKPGQYGRSITMRDQERGTTVPSDNWFAVGPLRLRNAWVHNNFVDMTGATTDPTDQVGIGSPTDNDDAVFNYGNVKYDNNMYKLGGSANAFMWTTVPIPFATWQGYGNDVHGQVVP